MLRAGVAGALTGLIAASAAHAEPPNLNILEVDHGEVEAELSLYTARAPQPGFANSWAVPELSFGIADGAGLQLQATLARSGERVRAEEIEMQGFLRLAGDGDGSSVGVSVEAGVVPGDGEATLGLLGYGILDRGAWRAAGNAGIARSLSSSAVQAAYAWAVDRAAGGGWRLGAEGGGEFSLHEGEASETYVGPSVAYGSEGIEVRIGYLATPFDASPGLLKLAVAIEF